MIRRIALWSLAGFTVACGWVVLTMSLQPATLIGLEHGRYFWTIADITAPAALLRVFELKYYWFILINAAVYALAGQAIELLRRYAFRRVPA